eukprot:TRINITY_DN1505_c0_g1_i1.p1 TRINITY_DN1505_c0_g1~~TRINITY_DN1505_c0_g1_i1.p1  ORF type:complete len:149 (-),score=7.91 TRINITY_DN1505_c0_g1_i1:107-553(-)
MAVSAKRLQREFKSLQTSPPEGIKAHVGDSLQRLLVTITGAPDTLYSNETFTLQFTFGSDYPLSSPEVVFLGTTPIHPHIYTNGHICLSILYDHWSPALTIQSVCLSILSMLSSSTEKKSPPDNDAYVRSVGKRSPKLSKWNFHDDGC